MQPQAEVQQKLNLMAQDAASIEKEGGGFMEPGVKRKAGRPKGSKKVAPATDRGSMAGPSENPSNGNSHLDPIAELKPITRTITTLYNNFLIMWAEDKKAGMDESTQETLTTSTAGCLNQYFPNSLGTHASLILVACIVGTTTFNAWALRKENLEKMRAEHRAKANGTVPDGH